MQGCINKTSGISFMGTFVYTVSLINEKCLLHELYSFSNKFTMSYNIKWHLWRKKFKITLQESFNFFRTISTSL